MSLPLNVGDCHVNNCSCAKACVSFDNEIPQFQLNSDYYLWVHNKMLIKYHLYLVLPLYYGAL